MTCPRTSPRPYKTPDVNTDSAIETPDDQTIVFHLNKPYAAFGNFAALPATVPVREGRGHRHRSTATTSVASGPGKFETVEVGKQYTLVRNDQWDQATDPDPQGPPG